jgi:hypothetical protein
VVALLGMAVVVASCAPLSTIGTHRGGASICSRTNARPRRVDVLLQDNWHHLEWLGTIDTGGHVCTEWDLPGDRGRWGFVVDAAGRDTIWDGWFQAWALERSSWKAKDWVPPSWEPPQRIAARARHTVPLHPRPGPSGRAGTHAKA